MILDIRGKPVVGWLPIINFQGTDVVDTGIIQTQYIINPEFIQKLL